jgi:hypothetical protein
MPERLLPLGFGIRVNQVRESLDTREVEATVLKRAPGKFSRLRQPQPFDLRHGREYRRNDSAPAVKLHLGHILPGFTRRGWKPKGECLIDRFASQGITDPGKDCPSGFG